MYKEGEKEGEEEEEVEEEDKKREEEEVKEQVDRGGGKGDHNYSAIFRSSTAELNSW